MIQILDNSNFVVFVHHCNWLSDLCNGLLNQQIQKFIYIMCDPSWRITCKIRKIVFRSDQRLNCCTRSCKSVSEP